MSVNKVILLGYVGRDPEIRFPQPGFQLAMLTLATNETVGNPPAEITEWHNLVMTGTPNWPKNISAKAPACMWKDVCAPANTKINSRFDAASPKFMWIASNF